MASRGRRAQGGNVSAHAWRSVTSWVLEGTTLELHPEYGSGAWFVVDWAKPGKSLTSALMLKDAKRAAERIAEQAERPTKRRRKAAT